jgi:hypothetical protein
LALNTTASRRRSPPSSRSRRREVAGGQVDAVVSLEALPLESVGTLRLKALAERHDRALAVAVEQREDLPGA